MYIPKLANCHQFKKLVALALYGEHQKDRKLNSKVRCKNANIFKRVLRKEILVATSPPLLENSISLPGSPIHGKSSSAFNNVSRPGGSILSSVHDIEVPEEALKSIVPVLDQLVEKQNISVDLVNKILSTRQIPIDLAGHLGLFAHSSTGNSGNHIGHAGPSLQQEIFNLSISPLSLPSSANSSYLKVSGLGQNSGISATYSGPITKQENRPQDASVLQSLHSNHLLDFAQLSGENSNSLLATYTNRSSESPSATYSNLTTSLNTNVPNMPLLYGCSTSSQSTGFSSPLHQITKGISYLTTGGGGSIIRGTSAACEIANQPLDLSMDVCNTDDSGTPQGSLTTQNWISPSSHYYDLKPLNLSPIQHDRMASTPPSSPNLCIIQEENDNGQFNHTISTASFYAGFLVGIYEQSAKNLTDDITSQSQPLAHP